MKKQQFYSHPNALVESKNIGKGSRIWAFAHILPKAKIGEDCNICDGVFVENDVSIGNRVTIKCGVQIWDGITLEDNVFIGPNATFTNDKFPRSKKYSEEFISQSTIIKYGASIGANATILPGITVGANAMIGAGAVITRDVPPNAIVVGNPAKIKGYVDTPVIKVDKGRKEELENTNQLSIEGAALYKMPLVEDLRGALTFGEVGKHLPFEIKRYFIVFDVPSREVRGEHAHKELHEFLVCLRGSCAVSLDDGKNREEIILDDPTVGLHIPPRLWRVHYKYSADAILLALCSSEYDSDDYIRDYDDFLKYIAHN